MKVRAADRHVRGHIHRIDAAALANKVSEHFSEPSRATIIDQLDAEKRSEQSRAEIHRVSGFHVTSAVQRPGFLAQPANN